MRTLALCFAAAAMAAAQAPTTAHPALVYGVVIERDAQPSGGQFAVRLDSHQVLRYRFDAKTYVVRKDALTDVPHLVAGEKVEVLSEAVPGSPIRYARDVHVLEPAPPADPLPAPAAAPVFGGQSTPAYDDTFLFTGDISVAGVVERITANRLILHTRTGEQALQVRNDTRFLDDGAIVGAADLKPNTRVFVKAGKGIYGEVEAYQIIWGDILPPQ